MFINLETLPENKHIESDICIVGAGAAGIAIAREFYRSGYRIILLESGGMKENPEMEELNEGENSGIHDINFYQRKRYFGGGTNCWGGNCAPLDEIDFESRDYVPNSGWPIDFVEIRKFHKRVDQLCGLESLDYDPGFWLRHSTYYAKQYLPDSGNNFTTKIFQNKALRFGENYKDLFRSKTSNIDVYLNATVSNIYLDENGEHVKYLSVIGANNNTYSVHARVFILAAGIENARLLLVSNSIQKYGIGNEFDTVGRYFMGHILMFTGFLIENPPFRKLDLYKLTILGNEEQKVVATFRLKDGIQKKHELLNYVAHLSYPHLLAGWRDRIIRRSEMIASEMREAGRQLYVMDYENDSMYPDNCTSSLATYRNGLYAVGSWAEQLPDPGNRITLSGNKDRLGIPRMVMRWKLNEIDQYTLFTGQKLLNDEFKRIGLGRIYSILPDYRETWPPEIVHAAHYIGSTRMSSHPRTGVVDSNCRVHGIKNLYIAGGSVMPTSGATMVTYNLLALALRLSDHIKTRFQSDISAA